MWKFRWDSSEIFSEAAAARLRRISGVSSSSINLIFYFSSSLIFALTLETRVTAEKFSWWPLAGNLFAAAGTLSKEKFVEL